MAWIKECGCESESSSNLRRLHYSKRRWQDCMSPQISPCQTETEVHYNLQTERSNNAMEINGEKYPTGRPCLMIPDFANAILSREPPSASKCSSPIDVITDAANSVLRKTFVASLAPPRPAYFRKKGSAIHGTISSKYMQTYLTISQYITKTRSNETLISLRLTE